MKREGKLQNIFGIIFSFIIIVCFASHGNGYAQSVPKKGGMATVGVNTDILNLDPHSSGASIHALVWDHVFERLVGYGEKLQIIPILAERWDVSSDFKAYTFYLREGRLFHNGREMVADDVKYTFERIMDPKTGCPRRGDFKNVESIEIVNKYTVRFRLKKGDTTLLSKLAYTAPVLGIVPSEVGKGGGIITNPIGTGPFKFVEWKPDRYILLERFDQYNPQPGPRDGVAGKRIAYLDKVKFVIIPEESAGAMALLNKEIDFLQFLPLKLVETFKTDYAKRGIVVQTLPTLGWDEIFFGLNKPFTENVKFRQACAYAIDREYVLEMAVRGYGVINPSLVPVQSPYYTAFHKKWYKKDVEKAKQLLKEAGYKGEEIVIDTNKKYIRHYSQAVAVQSELAAVGIKTRLNVIEWPINLQKFYSGDFQILSTSVGSRPEPSLAYVVLIPYGFEEKYPRMTKIRVELEQTIDEKIRTRLFEEAHGLVYEGVPCIVFHQTITSHTHWDYLKGYEITWSMHPRFWGVWLDK